MSRYIENICIKNYDFAFDLLSNGTVTDYEMELEKTIKTDERFLPKILVDIGIAPSTSEVRRNRKDLVVTLDKPDFLEIKYGKRRLWIIVN